MRHREIFDLNLGRNRILTLFNLLIKKDLLFTLIRLHLIFTTFFFFFCIIIQIVYFRRSDYSLFYSLNFINEIMSSFIKKKAILQNRLISLNTLVRKQLLFVNPFIIRINENLTFYIISQRIYVPSIKSLVTEMFEIKMSNQNHNETHEWELNCQFVICLFSN